MKTFEISVKDKIAVLTNREMYVCGNSDFVVDFSFDAEWDAYDTKTARFAYKGTYQDQVFQGTECSVPIIHDAHIIMVGVFAGNLHTTTPACIGAKRSILSGSGVPADPAPDVYAQIMELIQGLGEPDPETIAAAVADYIRQNPLNTCIHTRRSICSYCFRIRDIMLITDLDHLSATLNGNQKFAA